MCVLFFMRSLPAIFFFFFFNDTATTEIYTLSLHDALPICKAGWQNERTDIDLSYSYADTRLHGNGARSEEHTSELQSQSNLVCRLLLEKKKKKQTRITNLHLITH